MSEDPTPHTEEPPGAGETGSPPEDPGEVPTSEDLEVEGPNESAPGRHPDEQESA